MSSLANQLARARHQLGARAGAPTWEELTETEREQSTIEAQNYLQPAATAGLAIASVGDEDFPAPRRLTATVRGTAGKPLDRDDYADSLRVELELHGGHAGGDALTTGEAGRRGVQLTDGQAQVAAALLDKLAGVYRDEDLGRLARQVAVILYDRLGI